MAVCAIDNLLPLPQPASGGIADCLRSQVLGLSLAGTAGTPGYLFNYFHEVVAFGKSSAIDFVPVSSYKAGIHRLGI